VQQGCVGELRYGYASRPRLSPVRPDVDALWDLAIHDIAIFNHWLGDRPCQVSASGSVWLQPNSTHPDLFSQGLADVVWARLVYPSGFQATIHLCWLNPDKQRKLCMVGSAGTLVFDEMQQDNSLMMFHGHLRQEDGYFLPDGQHQEAIALEPAEPLKQVCTYFLNQIQDASLSTFPRHYSDGRVGTALIRVLTALSQSLNDGGRAIAINYR
jgi:predicted dehydrogenase